MKTIEIKIKNCKNCPFSQYEFFKDNGICYAPEKIHTGNYNITNYYKNYKRPKWCPLTLNEIKIYLHNTYYKYGRIYKYQ